MPVVVEPGRAESLLDELIMIHYPPNKPAILGLPIAPAKSLAATFHSRFGTRAAELRESLSTHWRLMSEIDDIFARLGGGRIAASDQRDHRDIPRRGKTGGSRTVEVVHLPAGRSGLGVGVPPRIDTSVRAQTWDGGFPTRSAAPSSPLTQPEATKAPEQVGHVITRWEPVAEVVPTPPQAPLLVEVQPGPVDETKARTVRSSIRQKARPVADPFDPDDDRANCLRCGYAVEPARERRGLTTCAACDG